METFFALLALCAGNSPVTGEFPTQRPVTRSFDVFFDLCLNKRLSKQWLGWWFETPLRPSWRHSNVSWNLDVGRKCFLARSTFCMLSLAHSGQTSFRVMAYRLFVAKLWSNADLLSNGPSVENGSQNFYQNVNNFLKENESKTLLRNIGNFVSDLMC